MVRLTKKQRGEHLFVYSVFAYPMLLFLIFYVFVNFNSILLAFEEIDSTGQPSFAGAENFIRFFRDLADSANVLQTSVVNSLLLFGVGLLITLPLSIIFSFYLYKKFFLHLPIRIIVMIPSIASTFIISLLFKKFVEEALPGLMMKIGVENFPKLLANAKYSYPTVLFYMVWISFSGNLIILPNAMNAISDSVIESAELDGANLFEEFWHIVLPQIYPTLTTFLITSVAGIFTASGPLIEFYMYSAPPETWNFGYYITVQTMLNADELKSYIIYPYLAATGIVVTLVSAPLTFLVKWILDKG